MNLHPDRPSKQIMHRDLKPSNILVAAGNAAQDPGQVKLADFGLARVSQQPLRKLVFNDPIVVTIWYRAPELLLGSQHYSAAIDVWALGCIFVEMAQAWPLFKGTEVENKKGETVPPGGPFQADQVAKVFQIMGKPDRSSWTDVDKLPEWKNVDLKSGFLNYSDKPFEEWGKRQKNLPSWLRPAPPQKPGQDQAFRLLRSLLELDPNKRISVEKAINDDYFSPRISPRVSENCFVCFNPNLEPYPHRIPKPLEEAPPEPEQKRQKI